MKMSATVLTNHAHRFNGLAVWYVDRSMYVVVHEGLKFCTGTLLVIF
jgi:hypothetical protein